MEEKVALVTGSAMGIGLACAEAFAKAGYITVLADIREPREQVEKLVAEGHKAVAYRCDVSNTQAVKEMIDWIVATYGRLDAALNNAGIQTPQRPMAEITDDEFDRTVAVDLKGVWNCMRYEILQMLKQGGGAIVNTSSQGGVTGFPGQAAYIACKHAVIGLTRTAAIDYAAKNIRINAVCPGVIRTPMAEDLMRRDPSLEKELVRDIPAGRLGKPEEIANAVLWICSPQASFVDGHALLVAHEMQTAGGAGAGACHVAGVLGDAGLYQNDIQSRLVHHKMPSGSSRGGHRRGSSGSNHTPKRVSCV